ncbi:hypothetical protein CDD82_7540 [Ophiocordyceps australis]|uniref:Annexin n=1 Tax=Ophiocordyceps australis TaxID=1399860 RepID=A0A2C5YS72_9HYPO|nr:hypothetical protein CDD82_7540 [Ophiocordyceps australis]
MSLAVDNAHTGRSSSPSPSRSRSRSRSKGYDSRPTYADLKEPGRVYMHNSHADQYPSSRRPPYPTEGVLDGFVTTREALYNRGDAAASQGYARDAPSRHTRSKSHVFLGHEGGAIGSVQQGITDQFLKLLPQKYSRHYTSEDSDAAADKRRQDSKHLQQDDLAYGPWPLAPSPRSAPLSTRPGGHDARSSEGYGMNSLPQHDLYRGMDTLTVERHGHHRSPSREGRHRDRSPARGTLTVDAARASTHRSRSSDKPRESRSPSPQPPTARMSSLTVDTGPSTVPASPLLEAYRGTYQACSPMPSPLLLASHGAQGYDVGLDTLLPLSSDAEADVPKSGRRARFHDAQDIAQRLAHALDGEGRPDTQPLIDILPSLTHEQVMELRAEYKRLVTVGPARKGVNIAKHIRARLKDEHGLLMKACYVVALGRWESEAYWANYWYHGDKTRRELLIEALMGRTNAEIGRIKDSFADKKYHDSLTRCMKTELKEDKFKKAILMVLDERRMDECDSRGRPIAVDHDLVRHDAQDLRRAVKTARGGESDMISIVVMRSDSHLRAVLQHYERHYNSNFARDALDKSGNLVGELLAHMLNGVINRPVRDALLLHHALKTSRRDELRRELLISRLVRFHWDPLHMQAVRRAYRHRYGQELQDAVREATSGHWGRFCDGLCIARMPNDVRHLDAHS